MRLQSIDGADARAVANAVPAALYGERPLALGFTPAAGDSVPDGTAVVIATSGSSGVPKRVILSADAIRASASSTAERIGSGRWMLALPAGYVAGLQVLVRSMLAGAEPIVLDGRFAPQSFVAATAQHPGDRDLFTSFVPAQLTTLLDAADDPEVLTALRAYRTILIGGQALPEHVRARAAELGVRIVRTYGSSETAGGCVYDGMPLDGVTLREEDGELRIAGGMLASGYLGDPALTDKTFPTDSDGVRWYRTGDAGTISDAGRLAIHGRIDNVIVSGGINVSLDRVERVVRGVPGLEHAVVLGIPDERWGEASAVFVAGDGGAHLLEVARARVAAEIGKPARPVQLEVLPELPLLASGKPDREALRRMIAD